MTLAPFMAIILSVAMNTVSKHPTVALDFLGCKLNQAEIQELAVKLEAAGYAIVGADEKTDIYVLNTCSVTLTADSKSRHLLRQARRRNPAARLIAVGCYAQRAPKELESIPGVELVLGNDKKMDLAKLIGESSAQAVTPPSSPFPNDKRRTRSFMRIQQGCRNFCAYCIVPYVRDKESSVAASKVISRIKEPLNAGCQEFVLTGTEIGAYNSGGVNLEQLLRRILEETKAPRLRISSLQPHQVSPALAGLWIDKRLCPHFHLSLQSGSDTVLSRMKRKYSTADYLHAVELIRQIVPDAAITTDVIVGFPGETEAEFKETLAFCRKVKFARIHVFPFSPRPGTAAASMEKQVPDAVKKARTDTMLALAKEAAGEFRQGYIGKALEVLWEQQSNSVWSGYTPNYIKVYAKSADNLANAVRPVKLVKLYRDGVWGEF